VTEELYPVRAEALRGGRDRDGAPESDSGRVGSAYASGRGVGSAYASGREERKKEGDAKLVEGLAASGSVAEDPSTGMYLFPPALLG